MSLMKPSAVRKDIIRLNTKRQQGAPYIIYLSSHFNAIVIPPLEVTDMTNRKARKITVDTLPFSSTSDRQGRIVIQK
ncbi:hypothetical protein G9A89_012716 [Geosiphon pyriformis]|nr:hypothetical protein G9A89_012716 [Geosiphon pyriformis]